MSLKEKLEATRAASASRVPADKRAIMERATADLRASGILKRSLQSGKWHPRSPRRITTVASSHPMNSWHAGRWSSLSFGAHGDRTAGMSWRLCKQFTVTSVP